MEKYPNGTTVPNLATQVLLPTPTKLMPDNSAARDYKGDRNLTNGKNLTQKEEEMPLTLEQVGRVMEGVPNATSKTSQLNPLFVMEMMGFPITWTLMPFLKDRPEVHEGLFYDEGWNNFPISNPLCPKLNKDDFEDITTSKWRNESIKAGGNAIVPQVALQIFKVIQGIVKAKSRAISKGR